MNTMYFERHNYKNLCWWCGSDEVSQEHKYKKSEIEREYGKGYYGDRLSFIRDKKDKPIKSSKSHLLTFKSPLCEKCNNQTSHPFDVAYDEFQKYVKNNQTQILEQKSIDLRHVFKKNIEQSIGCLFRYFVKQVSCVLSDSDVFVEQKLIDFLNGNRFLPFVAFQFGIALDVLSMESKVKGLQHKGHFSRGEVKCVLNYQTSQIRAIKSYFQYRWFRISYVVDKTIPNVEITQISHILPLQLIDNAKTYSVMK